ncbi:hypothetical protein D3218_01750 [Aureimonas flava]|uniref:Uncharacterized protein n=1 Tax=Aureimonas flava TaxID=2320271 RepID=A0A3A1WNN2_9HYPH|nr:hypothetical protein [Aureimonas flava]RIY03508.1 hypothetical protein D3218_01750 [Aureimonas flava]
MKKVRLISALLAIVLAAVAALLWCFSALDGLEPATALEAGRNGAMCAALSALAQMIAYTLDPAREPGFDRHAHRAAVARWIARIMNRFRR